MYIPDWATSIVEVVAFVDQVLPVDSDEVKVMVSPWQASKPFAEKMLGAVGKAFTTTITGAELAEHPSEFVTVTVYVPPFSTKMEALVSPEDQTTPVDVDATNSNESPAQIETVPAGEIVGSVGFELKTTSTISEVEEHGPSFTVTK